MLLRDLGFCRCLDPSDFPMGDYGLPIWTVKIRNSNLREQADHGGCIQVFIEGVTEFAGK